MVVKEDLIFRQVLTLRDGARVLLRPLVPDDRQALLDFFLPSCQKSAVICATISVTRR